MAISRVKQIGVIDGAFSTTHTVTVPAGGVAQGNFIIVRGKYASDTITVSGIADTGGNTYTVDVTLGSSGGNDTAFIASAQVTTALTNGNTIVVTLSGGKQAYVEATEFSGIATSSALDKVKSQLQAYGTPWSSTATAMTSQDDELCIGLYSPTGNQSSTPEGTWTEETDVAPANGAGGRYISQYKIVSSAAAYQAQGTLAASDGGPAMIATYKGAAAGGGGNPWYAYQQM